MEFTRRYLPMEWEERWRRDKERRKRVIEEGGEKIEEENRRLKWIKAYNDNRMGVKHSVWQECTGKYRMPDDASAPASNGDRTCSRVSKQTYRSATYSKQVFQTLENFRHSSTLIDLTLSTQDGQSLHAHSPVMAAVSSLIKQKLQELPGGPREEIQVNLGPEVTHLGLAAVLEFAYTGAITSGDVGQVRAAALALGAQRVLDICEWEDREGKREKKKEEEMDVKRVSVTEQLERSLEAIKQLWTERMGCDVVLQAEEREFSAHRAILAASSDYFRGMFTCGMLESQQQSIFVPCLGGEELEAFLHCAYSGDLDLTWDCVFDLVCSAIQFQIQPALTLCLDFLERDINADSCLDVVSFAEAYGMGSLLDLANDYVLRHFLEVSMTPKFQDLSAGKLLEYLCCDGLCAPSELTVFRAVVAWLEADLAERLLQAPKLMKGVRFPLMTFREFCEVRAINLSMECSEEGQGEVELYGTAFKDFGFGNSTSEECSRVRHPKDALVLVGGDQLNPDMGSRIPSRQLWFANALRSGIGLVKTIEWTLLGEMPEQARFRHGAAVLEGKLYIIGGCHFYAKNDTMKSGFCYDPLQNTWKKIADMHEPRSNFTAVVRDHCLYAIGGDKNINTNLDSVEVYCPESNTWSFARPLDQSLSGHAAILWKGEIFVSGGLNCDYKCLVSMCLYHPKKGTLYLADMPHDRALHCMESLNGRFYVAGGVSNFRKFYANQLSCEVYDPAGDSWCSITPLTVPHVGAASAILEEKLYILGGYCQEDYSESRLVHRFDTITERWLNVGIMPGPTTDIRACVFRLPDCLRK